MDCILVFTSYYFATKAEQTLQQAGYVIQLIATPPSLHQSCGLCILFHREAWEEIEQVLIRAKISYSGVYRYAGPTEPVLPL